MPKNTASKNVFGGISDVYTTKNAKLVPRHAAPQTQMPHAHESSAKPTPAHEHTLVFPILFQARGSRQISEGHDWNVR